MNLSDMISMLEETGYPVAYDHFPVDSPPTVPYIALTLPNSNNFYADNTVRQEIVHCTVELCTEKKDPLVEKTLTDVLNSHGIPWQKTSEEFIENDKLFSIFYEFEEVING